MHEAKRLVSGLSSCRTSTSTHAANPDKSASCQFVMVGPLCRSSPVLHWCTEQVQWRRLYYVL